MLNPRRIAASKQHHYVLDQLEMVAQDLYTAAGEWVSKYRPKKEGAVVSAKTFSTQCFLEDSAAYRTQVRGSCFLLHVLWQVTLYTKTLAAGILNMHSLDASRQTPRAHVLGEGWHSV